MHPDWTGSRLDGNDIGLLRLPHLMASPLQPLILPQAGQEVLWGPFLELLKYDKGGFELLTGLAMVPTKNCQEMIGKQAGIMKNKTICGFMPQLNDSSGALGQQAQFHLNICLDRQIFLECLVTRS